MSKSFGRRLKDEDILSRALHMILLTGNKLKSVVSSLYCEPAAPIEFRGVITLPDRLLETHYLLLVDDTLAERSIIVEQQYAHAKHSDQQQRDVGTPLKPIDCLLRKTTHCREKIKTSQPRKTAVENKTINAQSTTQMQN